MWLLIFRSISNLLWMERLEEDSAAELAGKARRARRIIIAVMALLILLPFILVWFTGAIAF